MGHCGFAIAFVASLLFPDTMQEWMRSQNWQSLQRLLSNVSPHGTRPGSIIASPSGDKPNYRFVWVRDSALVIDVLITLYEHTEDLPTRDFYFDRISEYVELSRYNQLQDNRSGKAEEDALGEPKYLVDGSNFQDDWGRPQDDGPALRASALLRFSNLLVKEGRYDLVSQLLPLQKVIDTDLRFVYKFWNRPGYDLWEEAKAKSHFYTRSVQEKALWDGAHWVLNATRAAQYAEAAESVREQIDSHWVRRRGYIVSSIGIDRENGVANKWSGLDIETIFSALHTRTFSDDRILATVLHLEEKFEALYPVNQILLDDEGQKMAPAIGRYPEDAYDNYERNLHGHPWFISTLAMAQYHYSLAEHWSRAGYVRVRHRTLDFFRRLTGDPTVGPRDEYQQGSPEFDELIRAMIERGDQYMRRVRYHSSKDGALHEQINRYHGNMQGAEELTWSHAAFLTSSWSRIAAVFAFKPEFQALDRITVITFPIHHLQLAPGR